MNTAEQVLVIIVSSLLSLVLLLSIMGLIAVLKLIAMLRRIAEKGEHLIDNAEAAAQIFTKTTGPVSVMKTLIKLVDTVNKHKKGK